MKFWCHDQRELKALLAAEEAQHFQDMQVCAVDKSRLRSQARNADDRFRNAEKLVVSQAKLLTEIEVACQRAQRAGSHMAINEIFDILDRRP